MTIIKEIIDFREYVDMERKLYKDCKTSDEVRALIHQPIATIYMLDGILDKFATRMEKLFENDGNYYNGHGKG